MGRARVRLPRPLMKRARARLPRPIMGRALVLLFRSLMGRRPVPRRHLRPSLGRGMTRAMRIPVRAITLTLVLAPRVGDLSPGMLGTPFTRSLIVLPFTAFFKGRCRTVRESGRGPRREKRGLAPLLCDFGLHDSPGDLQVLHPFLDLVRELYPLPWQGGEFNVLPETVFPEGFSRKRRGKLPRGFPFGKPKPFD